MLAELDRDGEQEQQRDGEEPEVVQAGAGGSGPAASVTRNVPLTTAIAKIPNPSAGALRQVSCLRLRAKITTADSRHDPATIGKRIPSIDPERPDAA